MIKHILISVAILALPFLSAIGDDVHIDTRLPNPGRQVVAQLADMKFKLYIYFDNGSVMTSEGIYAKLFGNFYLFSTNKDYLIKEFDESNKASFKEEIKVYAEERVYFSVGKALDSDNDIYEIDVKNPADGKIYTIKGHYYH